jgi:hypothetical protein
MADILDQMNSYKFHKNNTSVNNNEELVKIIRDNFVKMRQLNAKIYAHNRDVARNRQARSEAEEKARSEEKTRAEAELHEVNTNHNSRKSRVIINKSVITNNIVF